MRRFTAAVGALPILASLLIVLAILTMGCDDGSPTKSPPMEQEEYIFYMSDSHLMDKCYRYYSLSEKVDTVAMPIRSYIFAVSADGSKLYLRDYDRAGQIVVVDTDSFQVITELDYSGGIAVSPDGRFIAIRTRDNSDDYDTWILDAGDYSLVYHDTVKAGGGRFTYDGKAFYRGNSERVYRLDLTGSEFELTSRALPYPGFLQGR